MESLFKIQDLVFNREDFLDDISEFEDLIPIIQELSINLKYDEIDVVENNDCCNKTKKNYIVKIIGFLDEEDNFLTKEEADELTAKGYNKKLDLFVIRIYKCLECKKWIIDIIEE